MKLQPGSILQSTSSMDDPYFQNTTLLISEYDENGATGFVLNKLFSRTLNELREFSYSAAFPLYEGGPVQTDKLYFIHKRPDLISVGEQISGDLYYGGDFKQVIMLINDGLINSADLKLFLGYCGWDEGELENEIAEDAWEFSAETIF